MVVTEQKQSVNDSNTTLVKVKFTMHGDNYNIEGHSNTTLVKVKLQAKHYQELLVLVIQIQHLLKLNRYG